jgi:DNA-directed RNA polymerase specialized sigma24 family protein
MITRCDHDGRRCPICNDLIVCDGDCSRCAKISLVIKCGECVDSLSQYVTDTLKSFVFSDAEAEEITKQVIADIELRLPGFLKSSALTTLLPTIRERAQRFFVAKGVPLSDAEELAATLVEKVLAAIAKQPPRGNAGAFVATIRSHQLLDYWRKKRVERKYFGNRADETSLSLLHVMDEPSRPLFLEEFPDSQREIVERLLDGDKWKDIKAHYEPKVEELKKTLLSMEWDGLCAPLRKKRRGCLSD